MNFLLIVSGVLIVVALLQLLNHLLYRDLLSPLSALSLFWVAPCLLSYSGLSDLQGSSSGFGSAILLVCTLILCMTCLLPGLLEMRRYEQATRRPVMSGFRFSFFGLACTVAAFGAFTVAADFSSDPIPLVGYLSQDLEDAYSYLSGKESKLQIIAFGLHAASLFLFALFLTEKKPLKRLILLLFIFLVFLIGILKASKSDIYIPLLGFFTTLYYFRIRHQSFIGLSMQSRQTSNLRYYSLLFVSLISLPLLTSLRLDGIGYSGGYSSLVGFQEIESVSYLFNELFAIIYGYGSLGFENFRHFVDSYPANDRYGISLLRPFFSVLMMGDFVDGKIPTSQELNYVSDAANTGTFLTPLYAEGGLAFCLLGSLLYGLLVNSLYARLRRKGGLTNLLLYISILYPWSWLFFTNAFSVLSIYANLFYIALISFLFLRPSTRIPPSLPVDAVTPRSPL